MAIDKLILQALAQREDADPLIVEACKMKQPELVDGVWVDTWKEQVEPNDASLDVKVKQQESTINEILFNVLPLLML